LGDDGSCDMMLGSIDDALMMGEDFEIAAARDRNQRDAADLREAHASRRRHRHGGNDWRPEPRRFLDELDRKAMSRLMLKSAKRASLVENLRSLRGLDKVRVR